jgi:hypothetical protein
VSSGRRIEVVVTGDVKPFTRSMAKASEEASLFGKHLNVVEKSSHHLREGVALLAGAAGLAGLEEAIKGVVEAAQRKQKIDELERQQLLANHEAYGKLKDQIDATLNAQSKMSAFDDEDLKQSFTNLDRTTKNSAAALRLNALAADVARGRHMDLQTAALLVGKVYAGNVGILGRYGIQLAKGTSATEALGELQKRFAGQADAYGKSNAGAAERLGVAWENVKESLGTAILPALTKVENAVSSFFNDPKTQRAVEKYGQMIADGVGGALGSVIAYIDAHKADISAILHTAGTVAALAATQMQTMAAAAQDIARKLGGWKEVMIAVGIGFAGAKVAMTGFMVATRVQAIITAGAMKAALISTGIGAILVAVGIAVEVIVRHWDTVKQATRALAATLKDSWRTALTVVTGFVKFAAGAWLTLMTAPIRGVLEAFSRLPFGMGKPFKAALDLLSSYSTDWVKSGVQQMARGGTELGQAYGRNFAAAATPYLQSVSDVSKAMFTTNGQGYNFTGPSIGPTFAPGANRPGTSVNPGVVKFVGQLGGMVGEKLTIGTGTNHSTNVAGTNRRSDHADGNAVDIPASGTELLKLGRMALIAAGMPTEEAIRQTGGLFNVGGWQIIFNTNEGGNHFNHLHIGTHNRSVTMPKPGTPEFKLPPMPSIGALPGVAPAKGTAKKKTAPILPYALQESISQAKSSSGVGDDVRAYARALSALRGELEHTGNAARRAQIQKEIAAISQSLDRIHDKQTADKLKRIRDAFKNAFGPEITATLAAFDRATQRGLKGLQDDLQRTIDDIGRQLDSTLAGIDARRKALTPEEQALRDFRSTRKAQEDAQREADLRAALAQASTDEERKSAQGDLQQFLADKEEERLQTIADASREAADAQLDTEEQAARDAADAKKKAAQDAYDDAVQKYQDERDAQKATLELQLKDYMGYLVAKGEAAKQARNDLNAWLSAHPEYGVAASDVASTDSAAASAASISNAAAAAAAAVGASIFSGGGQSVYKTKGGRLIPMADGGTFTVNRPTHLPILAGEAGPERVSFEPLNAGRRGGGSGKPFVVQIPLDGKVIAEVLIDPIRREVYNVQQRNRTTGIR